MQYKYSHNPVSASLIQAVFLQNGQVSWRNAIFMWAPVPNEPANLVDVVIAADQICALDTLGAVHYYNPNNTALGWVRDPIASQGVALSSDDAGYLWLVNTGAEVWRKHIPTNGSWYRIFDQIPTQPGPVWQYTVKQGEWLLRIVRQEYNTWADEARTLAIAEQIKVLNPGVANWNILHPGDKLNMPPRP